MIKTLVVSDLHGERLDVLLQEVKPERLICLGDFDDPLLLRDTAKLQIRKRILQGNHDYHFARGEMVYRHDGGEFDGERWLKTWQSCPEEAKLELKLPDLIEEKIDGRKVVYVHGALYNHDTKHPELNAHLEGRIRDNADVRMNFRAMNRKNYWLLFRGHDHAPYSPKVLGLGVRECVFGGEIREEGWNLKLDKSRRYVITVGAWIDGFYTLFDEKNIKIQKWMPR